MESRENSIIEQGASKLTVLVFTLIIGGIVWAGFQVLPFFYYYYELENQMDALARVADEYTDLEIRKKLMATIKELELPVEPEDLKISRYDGKIFINLAYTEVFYVKLGDREFTIREFPFEAKAQRTVFVLKKPGT